METISRSLLTFLLNSLWQIPLAAAVAALACRLMRHGPASHRHAVWVAALAAAILLPLASVRTGDPAAPAAIRASLAGARVVPRRTAQPRRRPPRRRRRPPRLREPSPSPKPRRRMLLGAYFLFVLFRLARLAWASIRTVQIRRAAHDSRNSGSCSTACGAAARKPSA